MTQASTLGANVTCWVLTEGRPGIENQALGLAEALGCTTIIKRIAVRKTCAWLPPRLWPAPFAMLAPGSDSLDPPWPDLLIACGRLSIPYSMAIRRRAKGRTFTVQTQDPRIPAKHFDLVIPPLHDQLTGANVFPILGAPNRITTVALETATQKIETRYTHLPRPLVAVLLGGPNRAFKMTERSLATLAENLVRAARETKGSVVLIPSRRTPDHAIRFLHDRLQDIPLEAWDGSGENPYPGILGLADFIVVTPDSVNMATDAAATGKPLYVASLEGGSAKFERFHTELAARGITRPFEGRLEQWSYAPLNETARAAQAIAEAYRARRSG